MRKIFPSYMCSFNTTQSAIDIARKIQKNLIHNNKFIFLSDNQYDFSKFVFVMKQENLMYYNSFSPIINIEIKENGSDIIVSMVFELRKSIKIFLIAYWMFLLVLQVIISIPVVANQSISNPALLIPSGMGICILCISSIGLKCSAKKVIKILLKKLDCDGTEMLFKRCHTMKK